MSSLQHTAEPITVHLRGQNSDAQLAVVEMVIAAGNAGPPLHVHPTHAEGFHVLDGELEVQVGDEIVTARAGAFVSPGAGIRTPSPTSAGGMHACWCCAL